jgi:2-iminobutanoate/2-iminopropanoate deaminase
LVVIFELGHDRNAPFVINLSFLKSVKTMSTKLEAILASKAAAPIGPYSQAIRAGDFIFLSGQVGLGPTGQEALGEGIVAQTEQLFFNINAILAQAGVELKDVVKTTIFLATMDDFAAMNEVYARHFTLPYPARETVAVKTLPRNALVEISCTVYIGN